MADLRKRKYCHDVFYPSFLCDFTFYEKPALDENAPEVPEGDFVAKRSDMYYVSIDLSGKLGISYITAEEDKLNYELLLSKLKELFGIEVRARGGFTTTSNLSFINFPLMASIETISPRPILFIIGENAHSRYFSEDAYQRAAEPKEWYVVPHARHLDLYDRMDKIPFDKLEKFFNENLK